MTSFVDLWPVVGVAMPDGAAQYLLPGLAVGAVGLAALLVRAVREKAATENAAAIVMSRSEEALGLSNLPVTSSQIGTYTLKQKLGELVGFLSYRAVDKDGKPCEIKIPTTSTLENRTAMARLEREARVLESIDSPNVVRFKAYEKVRERGRVVPILVTEALEGEELGDLLRREAPLSMQRAVTMLTALAGGLAAVHRNDVVHRNIKPASIKVCRDGRVVLCNFGVAQADDDQQVTQRGDVLGTGLYLAPEALMGKPLDNRADLYSLGIIAYEMLTGRPPYAGCSFAELVMKKMSEEVPRLVQGNAAIPLALDEIVARLLQKDSSARHPSAGVLMTELQVFARTVTSEE